jgi:hypothetical protein
MSDSLSTYLQDHLAGAVHAIELLEAMRDRHKDQPLGQFAAALLVEIAADRDTLRMIADRAGSGSSGAKEATAWLAEKVSRLKLRHGSENPLSTLEALEFLELGIHGKWALWRALGAVAPNDPRLQGNDFEHLAERARTQRGQVEERRLEAARSALRAA